MTTIEDHLSSLESALFGANDDDDKENEKIARLALVKSAMSEMDDDERKEARKAMDEEEEDDSDDDTKDAKNKKGKKSKSSSKKGYDEDEDDEDSKKGKNKKGNDDKEMEKVKAENASLAAIVSNMQAKPFIDSMLKARQDAGMLPKEIANFQRSLFGKSVDEIKQRHQEDVILYNRINVTATTPTTITAPFNGQESLIASGGKPLETLEELWS